MNALIFKTSVYRLLFSLIYRKALRKINLGPLSTLVPFKQNKVELSPQENVEIKTIYAGVCGSDLKKLRVDVSINNANSTSKKRIGSFIIGHEMVGTISKTYQNVTSLKPGQRVVFVSGNSCYSQGLEDLCSNCEKGLTLLCNRRDQLKLPFNSGTWARQVICHQNQIKAIPDDIDDRSALLIEPLSCGLHAVLRSPPKKTDSIVVIGSGTIGLSILLALKSLSPSCKVIMIAKYDFQLEQAKLLGADKCFKSSDSELYFKIAEELDTTVQSNMKSNKMLVEGADIVFDAVGNQQTLFNALRWTKKRGTIVIEGVASNARLKDFTPVWLKEINIIGAHGYGMEIYNGKSIHTFDIIIEWLKRKIITPELLVSHIIDFEDYKKAIRVAENKSSYKSIKVALSFK